MTLNKPMQINNTDAEGRLVLSDGVAYARRDLKADIIVDMCTLTGAQGVATGRYHAAHMTNTEGSKSNKHLSTNFVQSFIACFRFVPYKLG